MQNRPTEGVDASSPDHPQAVKTPGDIVRIDLADGAQIQRLMRCVRAFIAPAAIETTVREALKSFIACEAARPQPHTCPACGTGWNAPVEVCPTCQDELEHLRSVQRAYIAEGGRWRAFHDEMRAMPSRDAVGVEAACVRVTRMVLDLRRVREDALRQCLALAEKWGQEVAAYSEPGPQRPAPPGYMDALDDCASELQQALVPWLMPYVEVGGDDPCGPLLPGDENLPPAREVEPDIAGGSDLRARAKRQRPVRFK